MGLNQLKDQSGEDLSLLSRQIRLLVLGKYGQQVNGHSLVVEEVNNSDAPSFPTLTRRESHFADSTRPLD